LPPKENVDAPRKVIVQSFTHNFKNGERVGVIGPNGVGKSTFIDILAGDIEPDGGSIQRAPTVTIGYYRQQDCIPNLALSVIDYVRSKAEFATLSDGTKLSIPKMLERFLFSPAHQQTFLSALSGGEKKRLHLLLTLLPNPNFLLLDEPTNDFDLTTIAVLEEFLLSYRGCLVVISHDRFFMDKLVDHLFVFE
jgi:ATP-binding cassette subfamily F protein uup